MLKTTLYQSIKYNQIDLHEESNKKWNKITQIFVCLKKKVKDNVKTTTIFDDDSTFINEPLVYVLARKKSKERKNWLFHA